MDDFPGDVSGEGGTDPLAPRRRPMQARSRETLRRILDAIVAVVERDGLANLSSDRIAQAAGVSVGTVYKFFPNKQSIVAALVQDWMDRRAASFAEICAMEPDAHPFERVSKWFAYFAGTPASHVLTVSQALRYFPELKALDDQAKRQSVELLFNDFRRHGSPLEDADLWQAARFVNEMGAGLLLQIVSAPQDQQARLLDWSLRCMRAAVGVALGEDAPS